MLPIEPAASRPVTAPTVETTAPAALSPTQKQALAERYAPVLYFHPDEKNLLQDPNTFLEQSSLRQERDWGGDEEIAGLGDVEGAELAQIGEENADADSQLFLDHRNEDLGDDVRAGDLSNSRNLYEVSDDGRSITYFLFYAYNDGPPGGVGEVQNHEGDWERVTVMLDDNFAPTEMRYSAHEGSNTQRDWSDITTENGQPVVYVGKGSHASYAEPGTYDTDLGIVKDYASDDGIRFDLSGQPSVDVTTQSWYGSHVLWGERGTSNELGGIPFLGDKVGGITSGPTGPSEEKGVVGEGAYRAPISDNESPPDTGYSFPFPLPPLPDVPGLPRLPDLPDLPSPPSLPNLPDLPDLPDLHLPDLDMPDIDLPDLPDPRDFNWPG